MSSSTRRRAALVIAAAALVVLASSAHAYYCYFVLRPRDPRCWSSTDVGARAEVVRAAATRELAYGGDVLLDRSLASPALELETRLRWRPDTRAGSGWVRASTLRPPDLEKAVLFVAPDAWDALAPSLKRLPERDVDGPLAERVAIAMSGEPRLLAALR